MTKTVCVYSSSSETIAPVYFEEAKALGRRIASEKCQLVYGGSNIGLMGAVASSVHEHGGKVIGVIPELIKKQGVAYELADELIVTKDMRERKAYMEKVADVFVALPGGFGTLEEVIEIITLKQIGYHQKPIIFLNTNGFYEKLIQFIEHIYEEKFAKSDFRKLYHVTDCLDDMMNYILSYEAESMPSKWTLK